MKWFDYREKLGIGFSDEDKTKKLGNMIATFIYNGKMNERYSPEDYFQFCLMVGIDYSSSQRPVFLLKSLFTQNGLTIPSIISYYVAFVNTQTRRRIEHRRELMDVLCRFLNKLNIPFEIIWDDDGGFVFPKGASEFDDALVSEPLEWLKDYPNAYKTYCIALKQYSEGVYIRDVADNLRKAFEEFLREFLGNNNDLNKNKKEIELYLKAQNADSKLITMLVTLISHYYLLNNEVAKHNDKMDGKYLEFLLYQTGVFIRMLIVVKMEGTDNAD